MTRSTVGLVGLTAWLTLAGCRQDMHDQPRYEALEASEFFEDGRSARPRVEGTIARGQLRLDTHLYDGRVGGDLASAFPFEVTRAVLERGQERYQIYCQPCHGVLGDGNGIIVERGFQAPPSYHTDRLREMPVGHFFDVITNGYGAMYSYASRVPTRDRWAIAAYIRALQLSQHARLEDVPSTVRERLQGEEDEP